MFEKSSKKLFIILILISIFGFGFISGVKKYFPYQLAKNIQNKYLNNSYEIGNLKNCQIQRLETLPESFSVVIGHAYGTHKNAQYNDFIADSISKFLIGNRNNIEKIIFTGDIFSVPSLYKWQRLFDEFGLTDVFVAPGNHDVERPDSMDVFEASHFIRQDYPFEVKISGSNVVLDDSVVSKWLVDNKAQRKISDSKSQDIIVARHHVLITELLAFANSNTSPVPLPSVEQFIKVFPRHKSVTWIMGDGGAFESLPRITCHSFENHRFIINGIGEVENDTVLILHDGNIFSHIIQ